MAASESSLVSVVIPAYNDEAYVGEAIRAGLEQTYGGVEVVVVNDGSTDGTLAVAKQYKAEIRLLSTSHAGAGHARNVGASVATGEYLVFLDADDWLGHEAVEGLLGVQESVDTQGVLSVCDWAYLTEYAPVGWVERAESSGFNPEVEDPLAAWLSGSFYPSCAVMWPRGLFEDIGGWDASLTSNQDGDLIMRALVGGARLVKSETGRSFYRQHADQDRVSDRRDAEALRSRWKVLRRVEAALEETNRIDSYRVPLGQAYHGLAKNFYQVDRDLARRCEGRGVALAGSKSVVGSNLHRLLYRTVGLAGKERLRTLLAKIVR